MKTKIKEYFDRDLNSNIPITNKTIDYTLRNSFRIRGSVRVAAGNFYTDEEFDKFVKETWAKKLP